MRKAVSIVMVLVIIASLGVPALAATGYGDGARPDVPSFTPSRGGGSGFGGGGVISAIVLTPLDVAQVNTAATAAVEAAAGQRAVITFVNASTVPAAAVQNVFIRTGTVNTMMHFDTRDGVGIMGRVYVDEGTARGLTGEVNVSVRTRGAEVNSVASVFSRFFTNNVAVVNVGHIGSFGSEVRIAVMVDLSEMDENNLLFFSYNAETNRFSRIATSYRIDSNGFVHFTTPVGGDIIITDRPFTLR